MRLELKDKWDAFYADMSESIPEQTPYQQGFHEALNSVNDFLRERLEKVKYKMYGKWISHSDTSYQCSICGYGMSFVDKGEPPTVRGFNYCPMCGKEMEDADEH